MTIHWVNRYLQPPTPATQTHFHSTTSISTQLIIIINHNFASPPSSYCGYNTYPPPTHTHTNTHTQTQTVVYLGYTQPETPLPPSLAMPAPLSAWSSQPVRATSGASAYSPRHLIFNHIHPHHHPHQSLSATLLSYLWSTPLPQKDVNWIQVKILKVDKGRKSTNPLQWFQSLMLVDEDKSDQT